MFEHEFRKGGRLKLFEPRDAPALFALIQKNREYLRRWLPWLDQSRALQDTEAFIRRSLDQFAADQGFNAGIWIEGELAGSIGLHLVDWQNRNTSIGYWLAEPFQGRGWMTEACRALVNHAFRNWKLERVEIACATENRKSRALPERLGFRLEGVLRRRGWLYDHFVDHALYSMLSEEWEAAAKPA